eukprot:TRINITY_DN2406_c0_g1_i1.p1 TRINITY_DN2406_c0_g1~~TRINITY_DN2406_c0_g1_i1.p1  ORF type:complete len:164 (-),score=13.30 TRINITY_DN2406_c0_g1_i1:67-558(-)
MAQYNYPSSTQQPQQAYPQLYSGEAQPMGYGQPIYNPPAQQPYVSHQQPAHLPPQQAYPQDGYPAKPQPYAATPLLAEQGCHHDMPDGTCYLICSFLACFFCCWPIGIVAIIFAARTKDLADAGDSAGAWGAAHTTRAWIIITIVAGIAFGILWAVLRFTIWN